MTYSRRDLDVSHGNIFETLRQRVMASNALQPHEKRAAYWFQTHSTQLDQWQRRTRNTTFSTLAQSQFEKKLVPPKAVQAGALYFFRYDALGTLTLPYYDRFPLVLVLDKTADTFLGLNFHYLSYRMRAVLFDNLYSTYLVSLPNPLQSRLKVTYDILESVTKYKAFRPCVKRYRYTQCRSACMQVGETEWDLALFLPVEMFNHKTRNQVWKDSLDDLKDNDTVEDDVDDSSE